MLLITMGLAAWLIFKAASSFAHEEEVIRHEALLESSVQKIRRVLSDVYCGTVNHVPEIEESLGQPDRLTAIMKRVVELNPRIYSCGISFVADYYPQKGHWFAPLAVRRDSTHIETMTIGDASQDYLSAPWFTEAVKAKEGLWSKPFFNGNDTITPLVSYLIPIHDKSGRTVAVLGADLSLEWLSEQMAETDRAIADKEWVSIDEETEKKMKADGVDIGFTNPFSFIITGDGTFLVHPDRKRILRENYFTYAKASADTVDDYVGRCMVEGKVGYYDIEDEDGKVVNLEGRDVYFFYAPVKFTDWSVATVVPARCIQIISAAVGGVLLFFITIGLLVAFLVSYIVIRKATKPLKQLALSADEVAKGNFDTPLPVIKHHDEVGLLRDSFDDMQHSLAQYVEQLKTTTASKAAIENELKVAHDIQMGMLPKIFPPYPERDDIDIFGSLKPAKEVGGDLFDFYIRDNKMFFCIGDVSGKGVPASLVMAVTRSLFRNISAHTAEPDRIVSTLNEALAEGNESNMFVTFFVGVLHLDNGILRYCNAGHDAPLLIGRGVGLLPCDSNVPLGVMSGWAFQLQEIDIDSLTTIFLYTDGLTEAENVSHDQLGIERVTETMAALLEEGNNEPIAVVERMAHVVHDFVGEAEQSDDLTMLAIKFILKNGEQG